MLIDTHTHVNFNSFKEDGRDVIDRALTNDIWLINVGSQYKTSLRAVNIANNYNQGVYAIVGLHPIHLFNMHVDESEMEFNTREEEFDKQTYTDLASNPKVVGIGETGLDYFHVPEGEDQKSVKQKQEEVFRAQLSLAMELDKAVTIHSRGTKDDPLGVYQDIMRIMKEYPGVRAVVHCYTGDVETAKQFIDLGLNISITGIVTFKNAKEVQEVAKEIPLEHILVETDAPYLAPDPHRGKRNEPSYVKFVAEKIAELKGISFEEVAETTTQNAKKLFKIS
ncbi:TatD family hydrolase [Patescibacteria group bacterium]|nr:TatD family hydrolase [Patescibacteria group bacterium]MBU1075297.1 TatD family hydrolase [Patescibacteria group bacterium]MBU1952041.1 TatD family hydrolase [Patescibacteria group bacterium]